MLNQGVPQVFMLTHYSTAFGCGVRQRKVLKYVLQDFSLFCFIKKRCVRDSNPWPHAWQACILTNWTNAPLRAENETRTRDPDLGKVVLYQLSYFRKVYGCGWRWIRTTEGVSQQIYSLPHLATLVFAQRINNIFKERKTGLKPATLSLEG